MTERRTVATLVRWVVEMGDELLVAGLIRAWAQHAVPDDQLATERAVIGAVCAYGAGASVSEACRVGRRLIEGSAESDSPSLRPRRALPKRKAS